MKKLILTVAIMMASFAASSQIGVITLEKNAKFVPMQQWYTIKDPKLDNCIYYYDEIPGTEKKLKELLDMFDLELGYPKEKLEDGTVYWMVLGENTNLYYIYYEMDKPGFSYITVLTKEG